MMISGTKAFKLLPARERESNKEEDKQKQTKPLVVLAYVQKTKINHLGNDGHTKHMH